MATPHKERKHSNLRSPEEAFGHALREVRESRSLSQEALAYKAGYHRTYIGLLERGEKSPSLRTLFNVAKSLQVRPSELLKTVESLLEKQSR